MQSHISRNGDARFRELVIETPLQRDDARLGSPKMPCASGEVILATCSSSQPMVSAMASSDSPAM